ncbi:hypothetical protein ACWENQ_45655 [Nonomuraea sp. NPDC004354]
MSEATTKRGQMSGKKLWFMTQEEYRASGLDKCSHPTHQITKSGLKVCDACDFIMTDSLKF